MSAIFHEDSKKFDQQNRFLMMNDFDHFSGSFSSFAIEASVFTSDLSMKKMSMVNSNEMIPLHTNSQKT